MMLALPNPSMSNCWATKTSPMSRTSPVRSKRISPTAPTQFVVRSHPALAPSYYLVHDSPIECFAFLPR